MSDSNAAQPEGIDEISAALVPLSDQTPPKRVSLLSRTLSAFWDSCTCCALAGSLCIAVSQVALKQLADDGMSVFQIAFARSAVSLPFFIPWGYFTTGMLIGPVNSKLKWIFIRGSATSSGFVFGSFGVIRLGVAESSFLNNSYPGAHTASHRLNPLCTALVAVLVWLMGIERMDWISWTGIAGALFSQLLVANPPFISGESDAEWDSNRIFGIIYCFSSVVFLSFGFLAVSKVDERVPAVVVANNVLSQLLIICIPFLSAGYPKKILWTPSVRQVLLLLLSSSSSFNQIFITRAFLIGPPLKATIISLSRLIMGALAGVIALSEDFAVVQGVGGALMLASIVVVAWSRDRNKKRELQPAETADDGM